MKKNVAAVCALLVCGGIGLQAVEGENFETTLSLGVTLTDGNSETLQANAALASEGQKEGLGSVRAGVEANYGESEVDETRETTVDNARAFVNVKKTISPRTFGSLDVTAGYDDIAAIDYRVAVAPGLGVYLVKRDATALFFEAGPAYVWEQVDGVSDDYFAIRFAERFDHALSETAKLWQSLEYVPKAEDFADYRLNAELGIEAAMNSRMNLRLVVRNAYDSSPSEDLEKNDLTLIAGVSLSF